MRIRENTAVFRGAVPAVAAPVRRRSYGWLVVSLGIFAGSGYWGWDRFVRMSAVGVVEVDQVTVASPRDGIIDRMHAVAYENYSGGDPLYSVIDQEARDELEDVSLQLKALESRQAEKALELAIREQDRVQAFVDQQNWFRSLREDARREMGIVEAQLALSEGRLPAAKFNLERLRGLAAGQSAGAQEIQDAEADVRGLEDQIARLHSARQAGSSEVGVLAEAVATGPPERMELTAALEPLFREADVLRGRIESLRERLARQTVRAPASGRVVKVSRKVGEFVRVGEPVVVVDQPESLRVVAYFEQRFAKEVKEGMAVRVTSSYGVEVSGTVRLVEWPLRESPAAVANGHAKGARLLPVEIEVDEVGRRALIPGSVVRVTKG